MPHLLKNIVITGAGSGIGRALAVGFAGDGWRVVGIGQGAPNLLTTGSICASDRFVPFVVDVADSVAINDSMAKIETQHGPVDSLVCCAALYPRAYFLDQPAEEWDRVIRVNVMGVANCCRAVLPQMLLRNRGRIVIVGSLSDQSSLPASSAYNSSKGAVHSLVRAIAGEIDPKRYPDVLVNEYLPNPTLTRMSSSGEEPAASFPRVRALIELPVGGPSGREWANGKEYHWNRSVGAIAKRAVKRLLAGS
jgi:NAD(P)-dependent dehydrogenase (short-subunit alcohol dehydrogenase family)